MLKALHKIFGILGFIMILSFFSSTIIVELFYSNNDIAYLKSIIAKAIPVLIIFMAITVNCGKKLSKINSYNIDLIAIKSKLVKILMANSLLFLVPCAYVLYYLSADNNFTSTFYIVQIVELICGCINLFLLIQMINIGKKLTIQ